MLIVNRFLWSSGSRIEPIRVPTPSKPLPGSAADHGTPVRLGKIARLRLARAAASKLEQRRAVAAARKLQVGKGPTEYGDVTSPALTQDEDLIGENGGLLGALPDTDEEAAALRDQMMAEMKRLIKADMVGTSSGQPLWLLHLADSRM
eukprot:SAG31_NODE_991_length_10522_cov_5.662862_2_plen_148_part_00